jgi:hypothetical protein
MLPYVCREGHYHADGGAFQQPIGGNFTHLPRWARLVAELRQGRRACGGSAGEAAEPRGGAQPDEAVTSPRCEALRSWSLGCAYRIYGTDGDRHAKSIAPMASMVPMVTGTMARRHIQARTIASSTSSSETVANVLA